MLTELGDDPSDEGSIQLVSVANDSGVSDQENEEINEPFVSVTHYLQLKSYDK